MRKRTNRSAGWGGKKVIMEEPISDVGRGCEGKMVLKQFMIQGSGGLPCTQDAPREPSRYI